MALIVNMDTSTETASVSIARDGVILFSATNPVQKEHASFLHIAIKDLMQKADINFIDLDAIAVTEGPGSYTGLRVGMAAAKGLAYALNKPFITINTLTAMAFAAVTENERFDYYCPMIDARRMEVYTALYNNKMIEILSASAIVLTEQTFIKELKNNKIAFSGSGSAKWKVLCNTPNCFFLDDMNLFTSIAQLSLKKFIDKNFTELAHSQPLYVKEFFNSN